MRPKTMLSEIKFCIKGVYTNILPVCLKIHKLEYTQEVFFSSNLFVGQDKSPQLDQYFNKTKS